MSMLELGSVMLVDDSKVDNFINCKILELNAVTSNIRVFDEAAKALEFLKSTINIPDLLFLDIYMPSMTGFDFLEEFQNLSDHVKEKCKVVLLSSAFDNLELQELRKYDWISGLIVKPLTYESLEEVTSLS